MVSEFEPKGWVEGFSVVPVWKVTWGFRTHRTTTLTETPCRSSCKEGGVTEMSGAYRIRFFLNLCR